MSKCKCSLREKSLGDGCQYCNPQMLIDIQADEIAELQDRIDELYDKSFDRLQQEFSKNKKLEARIAELEKAFNVTDISEYREPHSVINTGEAVHVMPTSVVKHIQDEGIMELVSKIRTCARFKGLFSESQLVWLEKYANKLEKGE